MEYIQANSCGHLQDARLASVSPLNRGFLYGDAIYEVWRSYGGVLFAFEEHWRRLERSAAALQMSTGLDQGGLLEEIRRTVHAYRAATAYAGDVYVRLQVTRGAGAIGLDTGLADEPFWVILVQPLKPSSVREGRAGLHLSVARTLYRNPPEALNPAWKTGNYLNNLLCLREARARGADEVVILNQRGAVSEAAVCNLFFASGDIVVTPPLAAGILEGITRGLILGPVGRLAGLTVREETIMPDALNSWRECFVSSSTRDVAAVEMIDAHRFEIGEDTATRRLKAAFADYAAEYATAHPQLRM